MKITVINRSEEQVESCDYRSAIQIHIDGKRELSFSDGEPEDSNLSRDFGDVYLIPEIIERAYNAGKNGEPFKIEEIESDEI